MHTDMDVADDHHRSPVAEPHVRHGGEDLRTQGRALRRAIPEVYRGFAGLHDAALAPGALDARTKELIALAVSVTDRCDGCISAHAEGAARQGASDAEVAEALGVAVMMGGGPATSYAPRAFAAFRDARAHRVDAAADL
jgi:AhpD family alkylhydroperoxidase